MTAKSRASAEGRHNKALSWGKPEKGQCGQRMRGKSREGTRRVRQVTATGRAKVFVSYVESFAKEITRDLDHTWL